MEIKRLTNKKNRGVLMNYQSKRVRRIGMMISAILLVVMLAGCSKYEKSADQEPRSTETKSARDDSASQELGFKGSDKEESEESNPEQNIGQKPKLIYIYELAMETLTYEKAISFVESKVENLQGYIESSRVQGHGIGESNYNYRRGYFTLRIPTEKVDDFMESIATEEIGVIKDNQQSAENITFEYYDTESRLSTKRIQEQRLLEIMKKGEDLETLLKLEQELADVRYEIDKMTTQIKRWDNLVDYTTINLSIREVRDVTMVIKNPSLGQRIAKVFMGTLRGLRDFGEGLLIFLLGYSPIIMMIVLICLALYIAYRNKKKKHALHDEEEKE